MKAQKRSHECVTSTSRSVGVTNPAVARVLCASPGDCSAVGQYVDSAGIIQGLLLSETSGTWTAGVQATLPANPNADPHVVLNTVSCASTGDCTAVGAYHDGSGHLQGLLVTQNSGTWGQGVEAALPTNAGSSPQVILATVSCASAGNCVAVDGYIDSSGNGQGLLVTEAGPRLPIHGSSAPPAPPVGPPILEQIRGDELVESQPTASPVGLLIQRRGRSRRVVLQLKTPAGIKQLTREAPTFIDVGRIPLVRHHRGRNTIHYKLLINGRRLAPGSYVVTLRSLKANKQVLELSQPVTLTINRHGRPHYGKHVLV